VSKFDTSQWHPAGQGRGKLTYTQIFGDWLCDMAKADARLVAITPAMREGSGMVRFAEEFPQRFHDVGIAEQHALTFAGGLACEGIKPVVAIYSTFLQRAYDQLIHDIALQNLPVMLAIDRGGLVGADGATHNGAFDLSYLTCMPNMVVMAPADENECRQMLTTGLPHDGPSAVRYPRGHGPAAPNRARELPPCPWARVKSAAAASRIALLAFGSLLTPALRQATAGRHRRQHALRQAARPCPGQGTGLPTMNCWSAWRKMPSSAAPARKWRARWKKAGLMFRLLRLGLPDRFTEHGDSGPLLASSAWTPRAA
jgi:1-deoxy-D-xylulose-5-phosphate synthase